MVMRRNVPFFIVLAFPFACAHGYGERYALPAPLPLFLLVAALVVVAAYGQATFRAPRPHCPRLDLLDFRFGRLLFGRPLKYAAEIASVALFLLVIAAGIFGNSNPLRNIAPQLVWIVLWLGVAYLSAFVGNVWPLLDPWRIIFGWCESLVRSLDPEARLSANATYPRQLGIWPGAILFLVIAWYLLADPDHARPTNVAALMIVYSLITWTGMAIFGRAVWSKRGEAFTVAFGLLARFAPSQAKGEGSRPLYLRPYAAGLRNFEASTSLSALILGFLAVVSFSAFTDTPAWVRLVVGYYEIFGRIAGSTTLGLLVFTFLWASLFLLACGLASLVAGRALPLSALLGAFAPALVPVVLAYHAGHYLPLLLTQGQLLFPLASDPFGLGWNLFGTADQPVDPTLISAAAAWYLALASMVLGHLAAARLGYAAALRQLQDRGQAVRASLPLLLLLTASVVLGLWMLAQPLVELASAA